MDRRGFFKRAAAALGGLAAAPLLAALPARRVPPACDFAKFVNDTLTSMHPIRWTEIAAESQRHEALGRLLEKRRVTWIGRQRVEWTAS